MTNKELARWLREKPTRECGRHICTTYWLLDKELEEWEKVEE